MNKPLNTEDPYIDDVICNTSLKDLPDEKWKPIENFENYAISNYGRVKSLERWTNPLNGRKWKQPELIMKLIFVKQFNRYVQDITYNIHCGLSLEGTKYRKSIARLVYYHFVEKFHIDDRSILITFKDGNRFHVHSRNLEKISASDKMLKVFQMDRSRNRNVIYQQAVGQYTVEGDLVAVYENMYAAEKALHIGCESIMDVINKEFLTAGGFRWFLQSNPPKKECFIMTEKLDTSGRLLNTSLWERLGKPSIDKNSPPACMNLSLKDLPDEQWKLVPGFENRFAVSDKGRVKRLSSWTSFGKKVFLKEQILSQIMQGNNDSNYSLYCLLRHQGKNTCVTITRLLYYCFVEEFDMYSKKWVVKNQSQPLWNVDLSKLSLCPIYSVLKGSQGPHHR